MFHIKEVAPTEDKSAFWDKDLKVARELNKKGKKPPPLNLGVLARGLKSALRRKQSAGDEPVEEVKLVPPPASPAKFEQVSLNTAFAFKPHSRKRLSYDKDSPIWGDDLSKVEEEKGDSIRYVGLEDMVRALSIYDLIFAYILFPEHMFSISNFIPPISLFEYIRPDYLGSTKKMTTNWLIQVL